MPGPAGPAGPAGPPGPPGERGETGDVGMNSTVAVYSNNTNGGDGPLTESDRFWLDDCLTAPHTAGPDETALVTGSVRLVLDKPAQGDFIVIDVVEGNATEHGNGLLFLDTNVLSGTVVHHIRLTEGVTYQFGSGLLVQGGGLTVELLGCQTMVQVVRTP